MWNHVFTQNDETNRAKFWGQKSIEKRHDSHQNVLNQVCYHEQFFIYFSENDKKLETLKLSTVNSGLSADLANQLNIGG